VVGIRGGLQLIPVNESSAVFSHENVLNNIAINNLWYLGHNLKQSQAAEKKQFTFYDDSIAEALTSELYACSAICEEEKIFKEKANPNIVIILLESWTADIIEPLGGNKNVTPFFSSLCADGFLFDGIYSSGFRTDQALVSVLSGFPAQPDKSIIRFPAKAEKLPSISNEYKKAGYHTSFYYGGDLEFANMNNYLVSAGIDKIIGIKDFAGEQRNSKWGIHDEIVLARMASSLGKETEPFLSVLLTLSTHEPFEVPVTTPFNGSSEADQFRKAAWYTDYSLKKYFSLVEKQPWYNNTIFILLADHGHRLPENRDFYDPKSRKIPVLLYSSLLNDSLRGTTRKTIGNQNDISSMILGLTGIPSSKFNWSNSLLKTPRFNFAYLSQDNAFTWITTEQTVLIPLKGGISETAAPDSVKKQARAYMQHLYNTFLAY
jgi:phosphoglycerol transferase MdoB-like AlkP superfamily enzyme